jgi:GntR family transcriptional regulator/MocR family aminotransferase
MSEHAKFPFDLVAVDPASATPMARQLYASFRNSILGGRLPAGCALPPTRALANELGIGRNTVIAAYEQLLEEGYLLSRVGSGTWVAPLNGHLASRLATPEGDLFLSKRGELIASHSQPPRAQGRVNLQPGFADKATFPFATWARLLARNARRRADDTLSYSDFAGHQRLREAISEYVGVARGVRCTAEQVIVTTGAQAALDLVARILMDENDKVWMEEPGYLGARSAFLGGGARLIALRVADDGWVLSEPEAAPRLIYVTPSCQWPRGRVMRMEERIELLAIAERHHAWIIEDDYDGEFRFEGRPVPALRGISDSDRVIYTGSFGKTMFSALRIGFLVVPRALADRFSRAISVTGQFAPLPLQLALADFIAEGHFARHLKRTRRLYANRQQHFVALCAQHLSKWLLVRENASGMQVMGRFRLPFDDREVAVAALRHGLELQPVSINFFADPPEHGLLLGFAGLDEASAELAVKVLRRTFEELEAGSAV